MASECRGDTCDACQARADLDAYIARLHAREAKLREALEGLIEEPITFESNLDRPDELVCNFCYRSVGARKQHADEIQHDYDCPLLVARAALATDEGESDGATA